MNRTRLAWFWSMIQAGINVYHLAIERVSLEEIFMELTHEERLPTHEEALP